MKIIKAILLIAAGMLLASCAKENLSAFSGAGDLQEITVTAYSSESEPASDSTKAALDNGGTKVYWEPGDEVMVFCGGVGSRFKSTNVSNSSTATFTGMIASTTNFIEGSSSEAYLWGLYPFNDKATSDGNSVTTSVPSVQASPAGSFDREAYVLLAKSSNLSMGFYAVCGGIRFSVSRNDITSVVFRGNRGEALAGKVNILFSGGVPSVNRVTDASEVIMVKAPNGGVFEKGRYYYAVMLPGTLSGGFTMTMYTADGKEGSYVSTVSNAVRRSSFATIDNINSYIAAWKESEQGGDMGNGIYLGLCGFNQELYPYPIKRLTADSKTAFNSFIDGLTLKNGTLLYYGVDNSLNTLQKGRYPSNLRGAIVVTFTDGLDEGSFMMDGVPYADDESYLSALNTRLYSEKVQNLPMSAYAIGLRGTDIKTSESIARFNDNLRKLSNPESNSAEVTSMSAVNTKFQEIAKSLSEKNVSYNVRLTIPGQADGTRVRFTFDNVSGATSSKLYIEGTFRLSDRSLTNISYKGFTSGTGTVVKGVVDGIFVSFTFDVACDKDGATVDKNYIQQWKYIASSSYWQKNSEFDTDEDTEIRREKHSLAVMLLLDCSKSLGSSDFSDLKSHAKSFISTLYNNSIDPNEAQSVSLNEKSVTIAAGAAYKLSATVSPSTAENKKVRWSTDTPSVATVDQSGNVTGISAGTATITVCTVDGGFTASCLVTVKYPKPTAVDMGLSVKWANCNLDASKPEEYGGYYQWAGLQDVTDTKIYLDWSNCPYHTGSNNDTVFTKYVPSGKSLYWSGNGSSDNKTVLDPEDDAAYVKLGGKWRMPTSAEWAELINTDNCNWTWTTQNGVNGYRVTSNKPGYTDQSIFLPAAGRRYGPDLKNVSVRCDYWSSSLSKAAPRSAYYVYFRQDDDINETTYYRYYGRSVRPVYGDRVSVTGVSLSTPALSLEIGATSILSAIVAPSNAAEQSVNWFSSNTSVATVDASGNVTGIAAGTATITVCTVDGGFTASCLVTVKEYPQGAVDMGLSVFWASCNLGAKSPEDYGDYYAWGETATKTDYSWSTYKWCNGSSSSLTKYYSGDNKTQLELADDVAHVKLGGKWRMPTATEFEQLLSICTVKWITMNGVYGRKFTSNKTGNSIFLPASGYRHGTSLYSAGSLGDYWSSSLDTDDPARAWRLFFSSSSVAPNYDYYYRSGGLSVRPVTE